MVESIVGGVAVNFIGALAKKAGKSLKGLFKEDELKPILDDAYKKFKESALKGKGKTDDNTLKEVFAEFFGDDRIPIEFREVFEAKADQVDFHILEEIFVGICIDKGVEIKDFDFFGAMKDVLREIETLAKGKKELKETFQLAQIEQVYKSLEKPGQVTNHTFARQKYLRQLIHHNKRLQWGGIPDPREKKDIELPSIFVMQRASEEVPVEEYRRLAKEQPMDEELEGDEFQLRKMMGTREEKKEPVKFDTAMAESTNPRFVVLGNPGSGKSTLLKYLMLQAAQQILDNPRESNQLPLPILVEIRKFENALSRTNCTDYCLLDYLYDTVRQSGSFTLPKGFFETYLESGRAMLFFDGLDEVAAENRRAEIRQMISAFVTNHHAANTVIVSSRIAGYNRARFSTTDYRHFTLEDFNDEEIDQFLHLWYTSRLTKEAEAKAKAEELKNALDNKPRVKELAKNPLLLTIIGIIHRTEAQLPEDRLVLYDKATESLLYTWDSEKGIIDGKFKQGDRRRFLEQVAIHLQSLEKGDEAGTVVHKHELYKILFPDFRRLFNCDEHRAEELVNEFLETIRLRAGLLVEQAPDQYGFVHKTFQEYFAAKFIARKTVLKFKLTIFTDYVDKYIDNAFWHETLLLALRALPNEQALNVLEHILEERDPLGIEKYFYHNHYFVMKFIAEQGGWLGNPEFVKKKIDEFFTFSWNDGNDRSLGNNKTWNRFEAWLETVTDAYPAELLKGKLLTIAEDENQDGDLRSSCASAVGGLGFKDQGVADRLLSLAEDENQSGYLRRSCASAVGGLGFKDQASEILLSLAEDENQDGDLRRSCALAVGVLGFKDQASEILLSLAEDENQDGDLRSSCASAVGGLGFKDQASEILLSLAEDENRDDDLRRSCAFAVGSLDFKDQGVADRLLSLAEDENQDGDLRRSCALAVGGLGFKDQGVADRLLSLAEDENQYVYLRSSCAASLGSLGFKDKAVPILVELYSGQKDKMEFDARWIYREMWDLTAV